MYGCDSVYVIYLRVEDIPYLKIRQIPDVWNPNDISDAVEHPACVNFNTASTNVGFEIFVDKNCLGCDTNYLVSLEYTLYRMNENTGVYELMSNVTDYFQPVYRTFFDQFQLPYTGSNSSQISIPDLYPQTGPVGHPVNYDYFNLCWFDPDYIGPMPSNHEHTASGDFYRDGGHLYD